MSILTRSRNKPKDILDEIQLTLLDQQSPVKITKDELIELGKSGLSKNSKLYPK